MRLHIRHVAASQQVQTRPLYLPPAHAVLQTCSHLRMFYFDTNVKSSGSFSRPTSAAMSHLDQFPGFVSHATVSIDLTLANRAENLSIVGSQAPVAGNMCDNGIVEALRLSRPKKAECASPGDFITPSACGIVRHPTDRRGGDLYTLICRLRMPM